MEKRADTVDLPFTQPAVTGYYREFGGGQGASQGLARRLATPPGDRIRQFLSLGLAETRES